MLSIPCCNIGDRYTPHFTISEIDAEDSLWLGHHAIHDEGETIHDVRAALERLKARQVKLKETAMTYGYGPQQEKAAEELLTWQGWELAPLDALFKELARGITDAQLEAGRMHMAYLERDTKGMAIYAEFFKDCINYLQYPEQDAFTGNDGRPYYEVTQRSPATDRITLRAAIEEYVQHMNRENKDWHQARAAYFARLKDIMGADAVLSQLTEEDGDKLEAALWRIPANYTKLHGGIELQEFLNGERDDYETISIGTVKMYWQAMKPFFKWCARKKFTNGYILQDIPLNVPKTGQKEDNYRPFNTEQLERFFKCPLYTGHKYANQRFWQEGELLTRNGNFWIPLVGLFAGLRLGEILYLQIRDIKDDNGVPYIDVNKEDGKSIKNEQSARCIPVHPTLKAIGFLEYCEKRRASAEETASLFDGISYPESQKISKNYSRNFAKLLKNIGIKTDRRLVFHSFRHNYVDALRRLKVSAEIMDPLDGRKSTHRERGSRGR